MHEKLLTEELFFFSFLSYDDVLVYDYVGRYTDETIRKLIS